MVSRRTGYVQRNFIAMRKKAFLFLILISSLIGQLFSIGFGYNVFEIKTNMDFGAGIFPTSVIYQFRLPVPDFIKGNSSELAFRLDNGVDFRRLYQNPTDGAWIDGNKELESGFSTSNSRDYTSQFDEFDLIVEQGFFGRFNSKKDLLRVHISYGGRFEKAFERWNWMSNANNTSGLFWKEPGVERYPGNAWIGVPELKGGKNVVQAFFTFGVALDMLNDLGTSKNGIRLESWLRLGEDWVPLNDGSANFILSWNRLKLAYTPFRIKQKKNQNLSWISFTIGNDLVYRFIKGDKVPYYIEGGSIYGDIRAVNTEHLVTNRTYITLYGPQVHNEDCYPYFSFFHDAAFSLGKLLNTTLDKSYNEYFGSFGWHLEWNLWNVCSLYYEQGYTYANPLIKNELNPVKIKFGFTLGI